jgi:hypothetical protein
MKGEKAVKSSPKYLFLHLLLVGTLYASVIGFITLIFQYIGFLMPEVTNFNDYYYQGILETVRSVTAMLLVIFPTFLIVSWLLRRDFDKDPEKRGMRVRKWLLHLTLFIASIVIIIDLITLIYSFLSGEITTTFLLRVLVILAVTGTVFSYYLWDLRRNSRQKTNLPRNMAWAVAIVMIVAIGSGFFLIGSPFYQREVRLDGDRISDLRNIENRLINYWEKKRYLPTKLSELEDSISGFVVPTDPEGRDYEYQVINKTAFNLCATFNTKSLELEKNITVTDPYHSKWLHDSGRVCFDRVIDPDLQKPLPIAR